MLQRLPSNLHQQCNYTTAYMVTYQYMYVLHWLCIPTCLLPQRSVLCICIVRHAIDTSQWCASAMKQHHSGHIHAHLYMTCLCYVTVSSSCSIFAIISTVVMSEKNYPHQIYIRLPATSIMVISIKCRSIGQC